MAVATYIDFTVALSNWRMGDRLAANRLKSEANNQAVGSLVNFETVKYFGNEEHELQRTDDMLRDWEQMAVRSQTSLSLLNLGQGAIKVTQASLRDQIAIVPQDAVLFNDTLYYNIAYARAGAMPEEVAEAARVAHLEVLIASLPEGDNTLVGERGLKLSGGEKQRTAIARAVLKNAPILVFAEATSSLDSHAEKGILNALRAASVNHTTLAIPHRLSTIIDADRIPIMQNGRLVESGAHGELLAANGESTHLWHTQREAREDAPA